ncbi:hypothetical protein AB0F81_47525 [Actinoplanes sp. NPDC024001]|uniref:hypothetical protein n=1 Tax=Actinoplanes sp. NPDC024001 TaxID=3154598 RepID=UPI0033ED9EB0
MRHRIDRTLSSYNQRLWVMYRSDLRIRNLSARSIENYYEALLKADRYFQTDLTTLSKLDLKTYVAELLDTLSGPAPF